MSLSIQLEGQELDLFGNESINMVNTLRDFGDLEAVIGNFTLGFTLPATNVNNKIFQQFYDIDEVAYGFNPHIGADTYINIHNIKQLEGVLELQGVELKERKVYAYKVVFYGVVNQLSSLIGEDRLNQIDLTSFNHVRSAANIESSWSKTLLSGSVFYPLIAFERKWRYALNPGNVNNIGSINNTVGKITPEELNPSYKLIDLLQEIFTYYGKSLAGDFITDTDKANLYTLPMQSSGYIKKSFTDNQILSQWGASNITVTNSLQQLGFDVPTYDPLGQVDDAANEFTAYASGDYSFIYQAEVSGVTATYNLEGIPYVNGVPLTNQRFIKTISPSDSLIAIQTSLYTLNAGDVLTWKFKSLINSTDTPLLQNGLLLVSQFFGSTQGIDMRPSLIFPDVKVTDFLQNIIKTFNLVLLKNGDESYRLDYFDEWLEAGEFREWDEYINLESLQNEKSKIPKRFNFTYKDGEDMQNTFFKRNFNREYGTLNYVPKVDFAGEELKVESDFSLLPPSLMRFVENDAPTDLPIPYMLDESGEPVKSPFLLFYAPGNITVTNRFYWDGSSGLEFRSSFPLISNLNSVSPSSTTQSLCYGIENDINTTSYKTLFVEKYQPTLESFYSLNTRRMKGEAYLPVSEYLTLQENDTILFLGRYYKIENISYNLLTEKADLTLITFDPVKIPRATGIGAGGEISIDLPIDKKDVTELFNSQYDPSGALIKPLEESGQSEAAKTSLNYEVDKATSQDFGLLMQMDAESNLIISAYPTFTAITGWDALYKYDSEYFKLLNTSSFDIEVQFSGFFNFNVSIKMPDIGGTPKTMYLALLKNGSITKYYTVANSQDDTELAFSGKDFGSVGDVYSIQISADGGVEADLVDGYADFTYEPGIITQYTPSEVL